MPRTVTLTDQQWTTIMAALYDQAERVKLPAGMHPSDTDEYKLAEEIDRQTST